MAIPFFCPWRLRIRTRWLPIRRSGQTLAQQVGDRVLELLPLAQGAEFHLLHERIGQIQRCLHPAILLVSQLYVKRFPFLAVW